MRDSDPQFSRRYRDCFELYVEYGGRRLTQVERRMRELGHADFNRRILYGRTERGVVKPGWVERYGWRGKLRNKKETVGLEACLPAASSSLKGTKTIARRKAEPGSLRGHPEAGRDGLRYRHNNHSLPQQPREFFPGKPAPKPAADPRFEAWLERVSPGMKWDWRHQQLIYQQLERVTSGDCKRLMIFLPPRHGKSELVTVRYTAWRMQQDTKLNVILGSYNQRLANRFSRKVRRVLAEADAIDNGELRIENERPEPTASGKSKKDEASSSPINRPLSTINSQLSTIHSRRFANSESEWETPDGGGMRAVGVGSGVTGFGASLIVIDDPVKSRAEAESATYRENIHQWFNDDLYTRLEPDGAIILIQTRWHEDDLAGRLLKEMHEGGEPWTVIALPAIAESIDNEESIIENEKPSSTIHFSPDPLGRRPGEALCPERFDIPALEKLRRKLGSYSFAALYQQRPTPLDGGVFKRGWFVKIVNFLPPDVRLIRTYDLAVSTKTSADYTVSVLGGYDRSGNLYIADVFRRRIEYPEQRRFVLDRLRHERSIEHCIELALHGQALIQDLRREPGIRSSALRGIKVETDKLTRSYSWANLAEEGKVILIRGPWNKDFLDEVTSFPFSKHDDQVDATSLLVHATSQRKFRHAGF